MTSFNATELQQLVNSTHNVLRLYYQKDKWPKLFPLLSKLAEQYDQAYQENPRAMQAQLLFYIAKQGYTTNLIINQTIICTALVNALEFHPETRYSLIGCNLVQLICAQKESNLLANQEPLSLQSQKLWLQRYNLASKLLQAGQVKDPIIYEVLDTLKQSQERLARNQLSHLDNQYTKIIALCNFIAKKVTPSKSFRGLPLHRVLQYGYLNFQCHYLRSLLLELNAHLPEMLPGTCFKVQTERFMYVCQLPKARHLTFKFNKNVVSADGKWHPLSSIPDQCLSQQSCYDPRLLFSLWFKPLAQVVERFIEPTAIGLLDSNQPINIIEQLNARQHWQIEPLLSVLGSDPDVSRILCDFATQQTTQTISELKHAVLLLGPTRVPLIVHKLTLLKQISDFRSPNNKNLHAKINCTVSLIEAFARQGYDDFVEYASICFLEAVLALLNKHNGRIRHVSQVAPCRGLQRLEISTLLMLAPHSSLPDTIKLSPRIPRSWHQALARLADIKTVKPATVSQELACLILTISQINQLFSAQIEPCALSNALIERSNALLKTQLTPKQLLSEQENDYVLGISACCAF